MFRRLVLAAVLVAISSSLRAGDRAVLVYPHERWSLWPVFHTAEQRALIAQLRRQYAVDVHDRIGSDDAFFAIDVAGAKLLVISGHGGPFGVSLRGRHQRTLDSTDRDRLTRLFSQLDAEATILLQSCHAGSGFAHLVKELAGSRRRVIAARGNIPRNGVQILTFAPFDVKITCKEDGGLIWDCTVRL
jgi:hypothetical protein